MPDNPPEGDRSEGGTGGGGRGTWGGAALSGSGPLLSGWGFMEIHTVRENGLVATNLYGLVDSLVI